MAVLMRLSWIPDQVRNDGMAILAVGVTQWNRQTEAVGTCGRPKKVCNRSNLTQGDRKGGPYVLPVSRTPDPLLFFILKGLPILPDLLRLRVINPQVFFGDLQGLPVKPFGLFITAL